MGDAPEQQGTITPFVGVGRWSSPGPKTEHIGREPEGLDGFRGADEFPGVLCQHAVSPGANTTRTLPPIKGASDCLLLLAALNGPVVYTTGIDTGVEETYQFLKRVYRDVATPRNQVEALKRN